MSTNLISRILPLFLLGTALAAQQVQVRMNDRLSSATTPPGKVFDGSLVRLVSIDGHNCAKGSPVFGRVTDSKSSGRLSSPGVLELQLTSIRCSGRTYLVLVDVVRLEGRSHTRRNATLIGGGAAAGAIIGGLAGGGKGALIGMGVGAGAGTVGAATTGRKEAVIEPEAIVAWNLHSAAPANARNDDHRYYRRQANWRERHDDDEQESDIYHDLLFTERERDIIRTCLISGRSGLPRGLKKKDSLPPGLERHLRRNGTLLPGLQKKAHPLPAACGVELPRVPRGWDRVILAGRVLLLNRERRIIDLFFLAG